MACMHADCTTWVYTYVKTTLSTIDGKAASLASGKVQGDAMKALEEKGKNLPAIEGSGKCPKDENTDEEKCRCVPEDPNPKPVPFDAVITAKFTSGGAQFEAKGSVYRTVTTHRAHCEPLEYD